MTEATKTKPASTTSKIVLFSLIGLPAITMALSTLMFVTGIGIPTNTTNNGKLIQPPIQIDTLALTNNSGEVFDYKKSRQWSFIFPETNLCDDDCKQRLYVSRQTHVAVGKNASAIRRIYLNTGPTPMSEEFMAFAKKEHPRLEIINIDGGEWAEFNKNLLPGSLSSDEAFKLDKTPYYLTDKQGFVMMYYTKDIGYKDILDDLKSLIAKIGGH